MASKMNENETNQPTTRNVNPSNFDQLENTIKTNKSHGQIKNEFSRNRICLRFLNGACNKKNCRYPHISKLKSIVFCHDYQNSQCHRGKCKFLHYSIQEEEYFRKHGKFPDFCDFEGNFRCNGAVTFGQCKHGNATRDRHDSDPKWNERISPMAAVSSIQPQNTLPSSSYPANFIYRPNYFNERMSVPPDQSWNNPARNPVSDHFDEYRDFSIDHDCNKVTKLDANRTNYENSRFNRDVDVIAMIRRFQEDQTLLRQRVEANEMKIAELRACNEHLLGQLSQYRMGTVQCSRVVNPVTVTNTSTQPQGQTAQVINAVSMAPVQVQATPIVSIAAPQTQIIASNGTPLSITNTSQGQHVALAQQGLSTLSTSTELLGPPPQILSTSQITLAPALAPAPSLGLTINTSQALAMSNASQPIISYPIMTHSILPH